METILITGGAGFIGSNFARYILEKHQEARIIVLDALTYAGNLANLEDIKNTGRFEFVHGDICDPKVVDAAMKGVDAVINFAAESHVDRSIMNANAFIETNVKGTYNLLDAARRFEVSRFIQISTDEVYGDVPYGASKETDSFHPRSPYAASKASAELLVQSFVTTYQLPAMITRGGNTIGPYQYPEKVVPVFITNALEDKGLPVYGDGSAVRAYMYVDDHCAGIDLVLQKGEPGEAYNIGTQIEINGLTLVDCVLDLLDKPKTLQQFVPDRPGHDLRYSLDCTKMERLGWAPQYTFDMMMAETVCWYRNNEAWWQAIKDQASYRDYYRRQYEERVSVT